ncbi:MAG TPA: two-component regulator propeller domain-containing protein [Parafilimonas sp.]|nr:two-component regulator propeller domain-containing protein [Parafilimonas sp.]
MMRSVTYPVILFCLSLSNHLYAQSGAPQYNFKQLNVQTGLSQNIVYHFLQDSKGYVWIGTHNGLTRYDGVTAVSFLHDAQKKNSLTANFITRIFEDFDGQVWVGNEKGIDLFNRAGNTFTHYGVDRPDGTKDNTFCVPVGMVSRIEFWFIDPKTKAIRAFNTKTKATRFICDMEEVDGAVYVDSSANTINFWSYQSNGTIHLLFKNQKLITRQTFFTTANTGFGHPLQVVHALPQNDTTTWLSTNEGLICVNGVTNKYTVYNSWKGEIVNELRFAAISPEGVLWMGTGPGGVYTFDIKKREFIGNYRNNRLDPFSICSNNIVVVYFDRSGNVWCGSYGGGASYAGIEHTFFNKYVIDPLKSSNNILRIGIDEQGNYWCTVDDQSGFWIFDKTFQNTKHIPALLEDGIFFDASLYKVVFDDTGHAWCVTSKGLQLFNRSTGRMTRIYYPVISAAHFGSNRLNDMIKLRDGTVIFSTFAGLYQVKEENGNFRVSLFSRLNEIYDKSFKALFQDEAGYIYVKGDDSLFILKQFSGDTDPVRENAILFAPDVYQLFSDPIRKIIYLATSEGLYLLDKARSTLQKQPIPGCPFQSVSSVFEKDNKFWLFGDKGLYFFDKTTGLGRTFTVEDGLPGNEFNVSSIAFAPDGSCVAGTNSGLVSFYPDRLPKNLYPPRAQLNYIYINDTLYRPDAIANETDHIRLTYRENTFAFDFSAIAFQHNKECSYEYRLEGYDKKWIKAGTAHFTRYSKIAPGTYTFYLRVYDVNGVLSPFTKTLEIDIAKAFWQTNLVRAIFLATVLFLVWFGVRWYFAGKIRKQKIIFDKQQAVEQERTRIAMEMHDDLGSGLTAIQYLAGSLSVESPSATRDRADKIASSAKVLVDSMNDIIWTMKSDNNTVKDTLAYIRKQAGEQLETANIDFSFDFPADIPEIKLSNEQKRNIVLIAKEAIHNIVKHSNADDVVVTARVTDSFLKLKIADNGKGFPTEKQTQFGNGLKSMHRRAGEMNAALHIVNQAGTTIDLTLTFG